MYPLSKKVLRNSIRSKLSLQAGNTIPLLILSVAFITIMALLFLNASAPKREDLLLPLPDENISGASQDNPQLIAYIKQLHIQSPTGSSYDLQNPRIIDPSQNGQGMLIANIFDGKKKGTFLEAGAYDGEQYSNTLYLERELDWLGLLVEPDPWNFWSLRKKSRLSHTIQCCLSPFTYPREVSFKQSDTMGHIVDSPSNKSKGIFTRVKCFPLYSLMLAQNLTTLDFLSLDIEGKEMQVLQTLPWEKVNIRAILIEVSHVPEGKGFVRKYLESKNYRFETSLGDDYLFIKK